MKKALHLLLLLPLLLASCSLGESETNELVICSSLPLDGGNNTRARSMSRAIDQAIDEKNENDGGVLLDGKPYPLRHEPMDDTDPGTHKWDTGQEARNARAAIAEHNCIAYVGTFNSGAAKIAMPILNRVQMAMVSPANTYPGLTKPGTGIGDEPWIYSPLGPEKRNFCRVVPADDLQAPAARYAADKFGLKHVFIFHDTEVYGKGLADIFAESAREAGMEIVHQLGAGRSAKPVEVAKQIMESSDDLDLVYFGGITENRPGEVLGELRKLGYEGYFMGADGIAEDKFLTNANIVNDDKVYATLVGLPLSELPDIGKEWAQRYEQRYQEQPDAFAAPSYEATLVVMNAIEQADLSGYQGDTLLERARPAVLQAIKETEDFNGILEPWSFDENCDTTDTTVTINKAVGGSFEFESLVKGE
ncbi:MAG: branched-chain amino acid ABC transporter substrate-binding protein [Ardenticatenaceae bacterium]